ncbi:trichohyalin-like isoform X2 [Triplophysa dalaica]|uniref:trichohyalin-like isoform X2 n=1 Tax=Triplophysa dalaica TaxID=1582913 RepID=UPI0024DFFC25|nr:trichohyalin-like isoform X2 [Triplophysa dalaica]
MARARTMDNDKRESLLNDDGSFSNEAKSSRGCIETFRLMVLGSDDALMNQACAAILGLPQRENDRYIEACVFKEGQINGRQVSLVKTPSYWLEHLKSFLFFRRTVRSLRSDMEFCESFVFPGPHAFLLVLGDPSNSSKEHLLLRALCEIFGKEVLDYIMVLCVHHSNRDILNNRCVKMCRQRYHILEKTENNVPNLFEKIENMSNRYRTRYFTKHVHLLETAKKYLQTELNKNNRAMEHSLKGELSKIKMTVKDGRNEIAELKRQNEELRTQIRRGLEDAQVIEKQLRSDLDCSRAREDQLRRDLDDSRGREDQLRRDLEDVQVNEKQLRRDLDDSRSREDQLRRDLEDSRSREDQLRRDLEDSRSREDQLRRDLEDSRSREDQLRRDLEDSRSREDQLRRDLEDAQVREKQLRRGLADSRGREDQLRVDNLKLQSEIKHIKDTEKVLGKTNTELQVKERELCNRQRDLDDRERNVESEKRELETREREVASREREVESKMTRERDFAQRNTWSGGKGLTPPDASARPLDKETGAESSDGDSQVTRSDVTDEIKPVRRNSLPEPPYMSECGPLHIL